MTEPTAAPDEFAALHAEAAGLDSAAAVAVLPPGAAPVAAEAPAVDPVQEAAGVFGVVVALASPLLPYLPAIYTAETLHALAAAYVPVAEKHGWNMGGFLDGYAAEIALVATAAPLAAQTWQAHKAHVDAKRQVKEEPRQPPAAVVEAPPTADRGGMLMPA